ncbi:MAG: alkaline phosphatase family protein [Candidatus Krumholzibacteriia bacterium]
MNRSGAEPVVLVFVDGLGWGRPDPAVNPCHADGVRLFALPDVAALAPGEAVPLPGGGHARPIDAVLGVAGIPQSATGQTTLLTGVNAQARLGRHLTGFPDAALRALLLESSLLKRVGERGLPAAFLNAYRPLFFQLPRERQLCLSATTVANLAAALPFRTLDDLRAGRAVYHDITGEELRQRGFDAPAITPEEAGRQLGREARRHAFTLFEYFRTDQAGHAQDAVRARRELVRIEAFLAGLLAELLPAGAPADGDGEVGPLVLLTSDHGNVEDLSIRSHTRNPVPLMAWGAGAAALLAAVPDLAAVAPAILGRLTARDGAPRLPGA